MRISFQPAYVSPDWDLLSVIGDTGDPGAVVQVVVSDKVKPRVVTSSTPVGISLSRAEIEAAITETGITIEPGELFSLTDGTSVYRVTLLGGEFYYERLTHAS